MEKLKIKYPIIVEGKYDKIKIDSIADACVITTGGFSLFKNHEKLAVIRRLAKGGKIIVMCDSDGAGKLIRSHISSAVAKENIIQLYTPQIKGREKRKDHDSKEGYLGVEGVDVDILRELLAPFSDGDFAPVGADITKLDFYNDGLTGGENSKEKRNKVASLLGLPKDMTPNAMLEAICVAYSTEEYKLAVNKATECLENE